MKQTFLFTTFIFGIFLSRNAEALEKSKLKIAIMGPYLEAPEGIKQNQPIAKLQTSLRKQGFLHEIFYISRPAEFSAKSVNRLNEELQKNKYDLIIYFQNGRTIPQDLWESYHYQYPEDSDLPEPKAIEDTFGCCEWFEKLPLSKESIQRYRAINGFVRELRNGMIDETFENGNSFDSVVRNFESMAVLANEKKTPFVMILSPYQVNLEFGLFPKDVWGKMLISGARRWFFSKKIMPLEVFRHRGFEVTPAPGQLKNLYQPQFLLEESAFYLNEEGSSIWAEEMAQVVSNILIKKN